MSGGQSRREAAPGTDGRPLEALNGPGLGPDGNPSTTALMAYVRDKVNHLLEVLGTWPLQPEQLDDEALIALDPIGIVADSFSQVLEHLRETNEDLHLAHEEMRAIFEAVGAAILVVDPDTRILGFNAHARQAFFPAAAEALGRPLAEVGPLPLVPTDDGFLPAILSRGVSAVHRDFVIAGRHYHLVGSPVHNAGAVSKVVLAYSEVTERVHSERSLQETQSRLKSIFDTAPAGILVVDAESHTILDVNATAAATLGTGREAILGQVCHHFLCPAEADSCPITDCGQDCDHAERDLLHANGRKIPVLKSVARVTLDGRPCLLESFIDITERKQAEAMLQASEERYRSLYSTMKEGVALHEVHRDAAGRAIDYTVVDVNPAFEHILGLDRAEVLGRSGVEVYGEGDPPYLETFAAVVDSGDPQTFQTSFRGRYFSASVIRPAEGRFATLFEDITERKQAENQVQLLAYTDLLTQLPNRALLLDRLREAVARCRREGARLAVLFLDLDRFKPINDSLGHSVGDALLREVAARLMSCVRASDTVARIGGDEFVVVLPGIHRDLDVTRAAAEIIRRFAEPFACAGHEIYSGVSVGIALFPSDGDEAAALLKHADMAMYVAKEKERGTYQFFSEEMNRVARQRLDLDNSLRRALQNEEFFLSYQAQVRLEDAGVTGFEALVRWRHPERGVVGPGEFIPACEETGLIRPLSEWIMGAAFRQARRWQDMGLGGRRIAVNCSGLQFRRPGLAREARALIEEAGVDPRNLELELTESMIMEEVEQTVKTLRQLKDMGLRLAIDDFGTGYSSLSYLSRFPIDRIKIAQDFVRSLPHSPDDAAIVETIIAIARNLNIEVIAEGVETRAQVDFLRARGCLDLQGFYFSRPVPGEDLTAHLQDWMHAGAVYPYRLT